MSDIHLEAFADPGTSRSFIDQEFIKGYQIPILHKDFPELVKAINRSLLSSGPIMHQTAPLEVITLVVTARYYS